MPSHGYAQHKSKCAKRMPVHVDNKFREVKKRNSCDVHIKAPTREKCYLRAVILKLSQGRRLATVHSASSAFQLLQMRLLADHAWTWREVPSVWRNQSKILLADTPCCLRMGRTCLRYYLACMKPHRLTFNTVTVGNKIVTIGSPILHCLLAYLRRTLFTMA
jgi:hypothetical protein